MIVNDHGIYHYPSLTDLESLRKSAFKASKNELVTLHFHPYDDNGCKEGMKKRNNKYEGLPRHEIYSDGELKDKS